MTQQDIPPRDRRFLWRTMIGRADFAFRSILYSGDSSFFQSLEHLKAIVEERRRISRATMVFFLVAIAIAFVIILKSADLSVDIQTPAGTIENIPLSNNVLLFGLAVATGQYVFNLLNHLLLNKQIVAIFEHSGLAHSEAMSRSAHVAVRWSAEELWIDILNFRTVGFRSGLIHGLLLVTVMLFLLGIALSQIMVIVFAAYVGLEQAQAGDQWSYYLVALPSATAVYLAVFGFLVAQCVPMRFKLEPASQSQTIPQPSKDAGK